MRGLELLGKYLGMFVDRTVVTGDTGYAITTTRWPSLPPGPVVDGEASAGHLRSQVRGG